VHSEAWRNILSGNLYFRFITSGPTIANKTVILCRLEAEIVLAVVVDVLDGKLAVNGVVDVVLENIEVRRIYKLGQIRI
jgi:hypothetical protein